MHVRDGVIVESPAPDAETIDCGGKTLAPGIVDLGVFAIDRAAFRAGGIVRVGLMPDQSPVLDDPGIVQRASLVGKPKLWIHPIAAATKGLAGTDLAEMAIMKDAGAKAVSTGRRWIADFGGDAQGAGLCPRPRSGGDRACRGWRTDRRHGRDRGRDRDAARPPRRARHRRGAGDRARRSAGGGNRRAAAHPPGHDRRRVRPGPRGQAARRAR